MFKFTLLYLPPSLFANFCILTLLCNHPVGKYSDKIIIIFSNVFSSF